MSDYTRRITPDEVVAAFEATGLKPARTGEEWFTEDGCACGAAALIRVRIEGFCNPHWPFPMAAACLEVSRHYLRGFVRGFDGVHVAELFDDPFSVGYHDGRAAAAAVFGGQHA